MKRIIPTLSLDHDGRLIEPVASSASGEPGDPVLAAVAYAEAGADELVIDARRTALGNVRHVSQRLASSLAIPFALQFDPPAVDDAAAMVSAGAARIVLGNAGLADPDLIARLSKELGSASVAVAMTARREGDSWRVIQAPDGEQSEWEATTWAAVVEAQGAGELIVEAAGTGEFGEPFDLQLLGAVTTSFRKPVLAAGAAERVEDLFDALMIGNADGVLVSTLLHSGRASVEEIKRYLAERGLDAREG